VKPSPILRFLRVTVSLVAVATWFHASNHCALARILPTPALSPSEHASCHTQETPAESDEKGAACLDLRCCKSLSAPSLALAKSMLDGDLAYYTAKDYLETATCSLPTEHDAPIAELDTGPPERDSFAEAVLQRSLLAHAPPLA